MQVMPMILRPIDTIKNFGHYIVAFFCYFFCMAGFSLTMELYSVANLDDLSWGNRPALSKDK